MGMFDYYQPGGKIQCPVCMVELKDWQGKDADCALLIWKQGQPYPDVSASRDEEIEFPEEVRRTWRLPEKFTFYSYDCEKHCVWVEGRTENDVWVDNQIILVEDIEKRNALLKKRFARFER
jgi:hypothetical protein